MISQRKGTYHRHTQHHECINNIMVMTERAAKETYRVILLICGSKAGETGAPGWLIPLSVRFLIWAQIMISWFVRSSPAWGSTPTVWSLLGILSLPFSLPLPSSLSLKEINLKKYFKAGKIIGGVEEIRRAVASWGLGLGLIGKRHGGTHWLLVMFYVLIGVWFHQ